MPKSAVVGDAEKLERKINAWLQDHLILQLANVFGEKCSAREAECKVTRPRGSFFLSDAFFANIRFPGSSSTELNVLVKLPGQGEEVRMRMNFTDLFDNEILFYQKIADSNSQAYPKCYLAGPDLLFEKVIVLENVNLKGYFVIPDKLNLRVDYVLAGLQALAQFHSHTYAIKEKTPEMFKQIVKDIKLVRYNKNNLLLPFLEYVEEQTSRLRKALQQGGRDPGFFKQMKNLLKDTYNNILIKCVEPVEPLATIVHGDCTQNNMLVRKLDGEKCTGFEAMLIDFALIMYSSPTIDVSILIYICLSTEDIKTQSETLFKAYHDMLMRNMKEQNIWSPNKYSYEAFWQDYKQRAIFGFIMSICFLPIMTEFANNDDLLQSEDQVLQEANKTGGGEVLTNKFIDMLIDVGQSGLLDFYLNSNTNV